mgnify:CR=1 FL=1
MRKSLTVALLTVVFASSLSAATPRGPVVNVNAATVAQLAFLPGIGPKVALQIVAGRPYRSAAELDKAKGIGPKKLAGLVPYVTVNGPTTATAKIKVAK